MKLEIEAVHQAERLELVLGQFARKPPLDLLAELRGAIAQELAIIFVIAIDARIGRPDKLRRRRGEDVGACRPPRLGSEVSTDTRTLGADLLAIGEGGRRGMHIDHAMVRLIRARGFQRRFKRVVLEALRALDLVDPGCSVTEPYRRAIAQPAGRYIVGSHGSSLFQAASSRLFQPRRARASTSASTSAFI